MKDSVTRLQNGDRDALREIVETYQAKIRAMLAFMGVPRADVDDVAQDAFIFAYQNINRFEAGTNLEAWLKAIARNKARSFFKAMKTDRCNKEKAIEFLLLQANENMEPDESVDMLVQLRRCVDRVQGNAREALEKRYSGVPIQQIADELKRSVGAIKVMLMRTRISLRACIETQS